MAKAYDLKNIEKAEKEFCKECINESCKGCYVEWFIDYLLGRGAYKNQTYVNG